MKGSHFSQIAFLFGCTIVHPMPKAFAMVSASGVIESIAIILTGFIILPLHLVLQVIWL